MATKTNKHPISKINIFYKIFVPLEILCNILYICVLSGKDPESAEKQYVRDGCVFIALIELCVEIHVRVEGVRPTLPHNLGRGAQMRCLLLPNHTRSVLR